MADPEVKICIFPGCERPAVPPHALGGPQPAFCDLEEHNALSVHLERRRLAAVTTGAGNSTTHSADEQKEDDDGR